MTVLLRHVPACPPEFAEEFVAGGWRRVERLYNARTDLLLKWIEMSGGEDLYERRRQAMRKATVGRRLKVRIKRGGTGARPRGVNIEEWLG